MIEASDVFDDFADALTRRSLAFVLASPAVRKPEVRIPRTRPVLRRFAQGLTRTARAFGQASHRSSALSVNLIGASLEYFDLNGCDLSYFKLIDADLTRAYLRHSDLSHTSLFRGRLESVDFTGASLRGADLRESNLVGACLVGADLSHARLEGAAMRNVDLRGATLTNADVSRADLRGARLDDDFDRATVKHDAATRWPQTVREMVLDDEPDEPDVAAGGSAGQRLGQRSAALPM